MDRAIHELLEVGGGQCPCCEQRVKLYQRRLRSVLVRALRRLATLDRARPDEAFHVKEILGGDYIGGSRDFATVHHWGLIEAPAGGERTGYWRITPDGRAFVAGQHRVAKFLFLFNNVCWGRSDAQVTIDEVEAHG